MSKRNNRRQVTYSLSTKQIYLLHSILMDTSSVRLDGGDWRAVLRKAKNTQYGTMGRVLESILILDWEEVMAMTSRIVLTVDRMLREAKLGRLQRAEQLATDTTLNEEQS